MFLTAPKYSLTPLGYCLRGGKQTDKISHKEPSMFTFINTFPFPGVIGGPAC